MAARKKVAKKRPTKKATPRRKTSSNATAPAEDLDRPVTLREHREDLQHLAYLQFELLGIMGKFEQGGKGLDAEIQDLREQLRTKKGGRPREHNWYLAAIAAAVHKRKTPYANMSELCDAADLVHGEYHPTEKTLSQNQFDQKIRIEEISEIVEYLNTLLD